MPEQRQRKRWRLSGQEYVTIESIAEYCMVAPATVRRWIGEGELLAIRLPSGHFRVTTEDFRSFLRRYDMPIPKEVQELQELRRAQPDLL